MSDAAIQDAKLLARVRSLVRAECAGHVAALNGEAHVCVEPTSPCMEAPCAYFAEHPARCPFFEQTVLPRCESGRYDGRPLDEGLADAYQRHVQLGEVVQVRRCEWPRCRKQVAGVGPASKFCAYHVEQSRRKTNRDAQRRRRAEQLPGVSKLTSAALAV